MQNAAAAIEPAQRLGGGRHAQEGEWDHGGDSERREYKEAGRARQRRQPKPEAEPGDSEEQADDDASRASAGHSRSQKMLQRARRRASPSCERAAPLPSGTGWNDGSARVPSISSPRKTSPEQDDCPSNRHPAPASCLSMIFSENRSSTFRDHARDNAATKGQFKGGGSTGPRRKGSRAMQNS